MSTFEGESAIQDGGVGRAGAARAFPELLRRSAPWALAGLVALAAMAPSARAATLFNALIGSWSGQGQIRYNDGQQEGIRCNAYYTGGGDKLHLAIRCRSESTEVEVRGQLTAQGDRLVGTWEERTFNAAGEASGRLTGDKLTLSIEGGGFKGAMSVTSAGAKQTVAITTEGIKMKSVNVTLGKS
jgi:hypothetical protein